MNTDVKKKKLQKKAKIDKNSCVACGACANACPFDAIDIVAGVFAQVDSSKCRGCSKCVIECPVSIIEVVARKEGK